MAFPFVLCPVPIRGLHAEVTRYPPHIDRDDCFDSSPAMANRSATPSTKWHLQTGAPHCLCSSGLSASTYRPHWVAFSLIWHSYVWRSHRGYTAYFWAQRQYVGLDCRYCWSGIRNFTRASLSRTSKALTLNSWMWIFRLAVTQAFVSGFWLLVSFELVAPGFLSFILLLKRFPFVALYETRTSFNLPLTFSDVFLCNLQKNIWDISCQFI